MKLILAILFSLISFCSVADPAYVGYVCDSKNDQLIVTYDSAVDTNGQPTLKTHSSTQWNPWDLVITNDHDHIGLVKTVTRHCKLSDGTYTISISASPGNFNVQGRCGAWMTASAKVSKGNKVIESIDRFETDCQDTTSPIINRVTITPHAGKAIVTTIPWDEFYQ